MIHGRVLWDHMAMRSYATSVNGVFRLEFDRHGDERGSFARVFCRETFAALGLIADFVQSSISTTAKAGTLRGMHYQRDPYGEVKLVRCTRGAIYDVVADLRIASSTYRQWQAFELTPSKGDLLYIPQGCAHGFQTLADDTEVFYSMSQAFSPGAADGFRFDDPAFGIRWPQPVTCISGKDLAWTVFTELC